MEKKTILEISAIINIMIYPILWYISILERWHTFYILVIGIATYYLIAEGVKELKKTEATWQNQ